jgi:cation diffusion facilitator CzcD-associated flavoprotein CzcO
VHLIQGAVTAISPTGLQTADHCAEVDVIILATGFKPMDITHEIDLRGIDGLSLRTAWGERIGTYRSLMVRDFPNLFIMMGPNSAGLTSALQMIEQQSKFIVRELDRIEELGVAGIHPKPAGIAAFEQRLARSFRNTTHNKGCTSWWSDSSGHNHSIWPESSVTYRMLLTDVELEDFDLIPDNHALAQRTAKG